MKETAWHALTRKKTLPRTFIRTLLFGRRKPTPVRAASKGSTLKILLLPFTKTHAVKDFTAAERSYYARRNAERRRRGHGQFAPTPNRSAPS